MNKITKWVGLGFISLLAILSILIFNSASKVDAAAQRSEDGIIALKGLDNAGTMINMRYIKVPINGVDYIFEDSNPADDTHKYKVQDNGGCWGEIKFDYNKKGPIGDLTASGGTADHPTGGEFTGVTLDMDWLPELNKPDDCDDVSTGNFPIDIVPSGNNIWYEYIDDRTIRDVYETTYIPSTTPGADSRLWREEDATGCVDLLIVSGSSLKTYQMKKSGAGSGQGGNKDKVNADDLAVLEPLYGDNCKVDKTIPWDAPLDNGKPKAFDGTVATFPIGDARTNTLPQGVGGLPGDPNDGSIGPDCYTGLKNGFSWLVCPTLGFIDDFIDWAEEAISKQLTVDLGAQDTRDKLQESWRIVARFSSGILVAIALVMVIATALGSDLISPYALKKVLPRLVLGAIGIWLSWALVSTYIDIMNDLGKGIAGIMLSPFGEARNFSLQNIAGIAGAATDGGNEQALFVGLATAGIISAGIFGLLGLGVTALMAFTVAIVILALRQAVIIFLIIVAPFAFAMSILPNTQKVWKLWSGTLNKLLLMFPMIMAVLAAGKIFAYITSESINENNSPEERFMGFALSLIAYVAPYFFLPALFKAAGGLFNNLTGMVNNSSKGIFDKMRGGLDAKAKARKTFKDQMSNENLARTASGKGPMASFARSRMRAKGGQPILGGYASLRHGTLTRNRVKSSMEAAQEKLEEQMVQEETAKMAKDGTLGKKDELVVIANSGTIPQRRAAIARLGQLAGGKEVREIKEKAMTGTDTRVKDMWNKIQASKDFAEAFKDSDPDLLMGQSAYNTGLAGGKIVKMSPRSYEEATEQYTTARSLITNIATGAIDRKNLTAKQEAIVSAYEKNPVTGKSDLFDPVTGLFDATGSLDRLEKAVKVTASGAKLAVTNPGLRSDFKAPSAVAAREMLLKLDAAFPGLATADIAYAVNKIDPTSGLK